MSLIFFSHKYINFLHSKWKQASILITLVSPYEGKNVRIPLFLHAVKSLHIKHFIVMSTVSSGGYLAVLLPVVQSDKYSDSIETFI